MTTHTLKTLTPYFHLLETHVKTFEVRFNDRNFQVGDILHLREYTEAQTFTGKSLERKVVYLLDDPTYCKDGFVIMGIEPMNTNTLTSFEHILKEAFNHSPQWTLHEKLSAVINLLYVFVDDPTLEHELHRIHDYLTQKKKGTDVDETPPITHCCPCTKHVLHCVHVQYPDCDCFPATYKLPKEGK